MPTKKETWMLTFSLAAAALLLSVMVVDIAPARGQATADKEEGRVRVGRLIYAGGQSSKCFSEGFLEMADRNMDSTISRKFEGVQLASDDIFEFPFIVMTGPEGFKLTKAEKKQLKKYIERGGFILASAGCSNNAWNSSFKSLMKEIYPDAKLNELDTNHPLFHQLTDVDRIIPSHGSAKGAVFGLEIDGRLAMVYSPLGLNDSSEAGASCCCCGGNEVRNAKEINANILSYALTH